MRTAHSIVRSPACTPFQLHFPTTTGLYTLTHAHHALLLLCDLDFTAVSLTSPPGLKLLLLFLLQQVLFVTLRRSCRRCCFSAQATMVTMTLADARMCVNWRRLWQKMQIRGNSATTKLHFAGERREGGGQKSQILKFCTSLSAEDYALQLPCSRGGGGGGVEAAVFCHCHSQTSAVF